MEFAKRYVRSAVGLCTMKHWTLWKGRPPHETVEEFTRIVGVREAGDVRAPDNFASTFGTETDRRTIEDRNHIKVQLGTSALKEGAPVAGEE